MFELHRISQEKTSKITAVNFTAVIFGIKCSGGYANFAIVWRMAVRC